MDVTSGPCLKTGESNDKMAGKASKAIVFVCFVFEEGTNRNISFFFFFYYSKPFPCHVIVKVAFETIYFVTY